MFSNSSFTLATSNDQILIIDGTRVGDVRVYEDSIMQTVIQRWGTGGGNVPAIAVDFYNQRITEKNQTLSSAASDASHYGGILDTEKMTIRRLTPKECERLQGFPDDWTAGQPDSARYKQMGNAVAVPVVSWIIEKMVANG
jgi:DNA (cytosine-5)-methyltransferase 1